ncbi:DUF2637 domain-containing protein [Streptomyces sp. NPDC056056]|uniref:DUF2637 domain-containing protein n=1 Tax=Streptomyces sp. NPDC056056 TaxID=3345698 RepID=UPI0035DE430D
MSNTSFAPTEKESTEPQQNSEAVEKFLRKLTWFIITGSLIVGGIGFAGSYKSVREKAEEKGFGSFSYFLPVGVDAGIIVLLGLDLWLTYKRMPFPILRYAAWGLTVATIYFNANAGVPEPTALNPHPRLTDDLMAVGMHATMPILFIVITEAARHAARRLANLAAGQQMDKVRASRWLLDLNHTFGLWRQMKIREIRSYDKALELEKERLIYEERVKARYGKVVAAPVHVALPLKLARYGEPLPEPPLTEAEEVELAAAQAREKAEREEREAREATAREAEMKRRQEEKDEENRLAREAREADREARREEREANREAHDLELARIREESEARLREAREAAALRAAEDERRARREAEEFAREEARRKAEAQVRVEEAARREAARLASQQPREPQATPSQRPRETISKGSQKGASQNARAMTRDELAAQREDAELHAASLLVEGNRPTATAFGKLYGQRETWGGDRLREADKRLAQDPDFRSRAETMALERMAVAEPVGNAQ